MKHFIFSPSGVCSRSIEFDIEDNKIYNLQFQGGCPGNLKAIGKLVEGMDARKVSEVLSGNTCGPRQTSCADQLSKAISEAIK